MHLQTVIDEKCLFSFQLELVWKIDRHFSCSILFFSVLSVCCLRKLLPLKTCCSPQFCPAWSVAGIHSQCDPVSSWCPRMSSCSVSHLWPWPVGTTLLHWYNTHVCREMGNAFTDHDNCSVQIIPSGTNTSTRKGSAGPWKVNLVFTEMTLLCVHV